MRKVKRQACSERIQVSLKPDELADAKRACEERQAELGPGVRISLSSWAGDVLRDWLATRKLKAVG